MDVRCWRWCWFAPTQLLARGWQLQYWGVVLGRPWPWATVTVSKVHIHKGDVPWPLFNYTACSWDQVSFVIWRPSCSSRQFCRVSERLSLESSMWASGVAVDGKRYLKNKYQVVWLSHLEFWCNSRELLQWVHLVFPNISVYSISLAKSHAKLKEGE